LRGLASERGLGWIFAGTVLLIWSFWPVWTRHGVTGKLTPEDIVFLRFGIGGLIFLPFLAAQARSIPLRLWLIGFGLAVCQGAPFVLLMAIGLRYAPANHAASLATGASPIFAALLSAAFLAEPIAKMRWAGLMIVLGGTGALALSQAGAHSAIGHLFFIAAAAMASVYIVFVSRSGLSSFQAAAMVSVFSMAIYVPIYLLLGLGRLAEAPLGDIVVQGTYQGLFVAVASFVLLNGAIARLGAPHVSALVALVPALTLVLAIPTLGEWPTPVEIVSVILVGAGVCLAASASRGTGIALPRQRPRINAA
jgi:drug/metabolite transporter (DMT)-like permease